MGILSSLVDQVLVYRIIIDDISAIIASNLLAIDRRIAYKRHHSGEI